MDNIIEIKNLSKHFGEIKAVDGISFDVQRGSLFAFLGINGAGKSTTISIICGQLKKDSGTISVNGFDLDTQEKQIKSDLGVVFQNSILDAPLSVIDNLKTRAAMYGIFGTDFDKRLNELSELLDLKPLLKRPIGKLSGGQRRRIDIARAILHKPKILILDEPTTGLDPQTRRTVWDTINTLRENENITVFLTTHYMEEAADADYVVILDSGKIVAEGTPIDLKNRFTGDFITLYGIEEDSLSALGIQYTQTQNSFKISVENTAAATELILKHPHIFSDYEIVKGKMDDVFLAATGKRLTNEDETTQTKGGRKK